LNKELSRKATQRGLYVISFEVAENRTNLPLSCGGTNVLAAAFLAPRGCADWALGNLLRGAIADPFDSLFLDELPTIEGEPPGGREGEAKRSATSGSSNDAVGRETLLKLDDATVLNQTKTENQVKNLETEDKERYASQLIWDTART
jgi:hypothetical protein